MTDSANVLVGALKNHRHDQVNHFAKEYARYEDGVCITTNSVEGFFGILKRGINGVYHHVGQQHLHRYLTELLPLQFAERNGLHENHTRAEKHDGKAADAPGLTPAQLSWEGKRPFQKGQ